MTVGTLSGQHLAFFEWVNTAVPCTPCQISLWSVKNKYMYKVKMCLNTKK